MIELINSFHILPVDLLLLSYKSIEEKFACINYITAQQYKHTPTHTQVENYMRRVLHEATQHVKVFKTNLFRACLTHGSRDFDSIYYIQKLSRASSNREVYVVIHERRGKSYHQSTSVRFLGAVCFIVQFNLMKLKPYTF